MENPLGVRRAHPARCVVVRHADGKQGMIQLAPSSLGSLSRFRAFRGHTI